tara:strand:- start:15213 stop:15815 length:603 start_codon:yes stop_codon:yes gene_type:complete
MGILPTFGNIGVLIASMYPAFIVTFLIVASIFNLKINGLIYLFGILITFGICYATAMMFGKERNIIDTSCDLFSTLGYHYQNPSFQSAVTVYTYVYLLIPMIQNSLINPVVLATLPIFSGINMVYLKVKGCASGPGLLMGSVIGGLIAAVMVGILSLSDNKSLLFYNELVSNNVICKKPSKQMFKCSVYKNGELVSSSIA